MENKINTEKISDYIGAHNLTKTAFCKLCRISISTFNRILSGENFFINALFKIARVMKVEVYTLCN